MRTALMSLLFCLVLAPVAHAEAFSINLNAFVGQQYLSDSEWKDVDLDQQLHYGLMADAGVMLIPFDFALDLLTTSEEATVAGDTIEVDNLEVYLGIRKYFNIVPILTPYVGAGATWVQSDLKINSDSQDADALGWWLNGGVVYRIKERINVGIDLRYSSTELDYESLGGKTDLEGVMVGLIAGLHF